MKYYILSAFLLSLFIFSCNDTEDIPKYSTPEATTELGVGIVQSGLIAIVHKETLVTPATGVKEFYMDFLSSAGYLGKIHVFEIDLKIPNINIAVCTSKNSSSTTLFSTQTLTEQVELINSESNKIIGAMNGGSFASNNSRPYGIVVKNGVAIKKAFTATGSNANLVYFAITNQKKAQIGNADELDKSLMFTDIQNAIGGKEWLVEEGVARALSRDLISAKSVVGTIGNDKVLFFIVDSGDYYIANGMLGSDVSKILITLGVNNAILINDGPSCSLLANGEEGIYVKNFPQNNGIETKVANGLVIVQN